MMYCLPKFESEEAAKSQTERLQTQHWWRCGQKMMVSSWNFETLCKQVFWEDWQRHQPCTQQQNFYATANRMRCIRPAMFEVSNEFFQQSLALVRHLSFIWGARASVANCLNKFGRKIACFMVFSTDRVTRAFRCCARYLCCCQSFRKTCCTTF